MKKNRCVICVAVILISVSVFGCAKAAYKDGVYLGKSGVDDSGAWAEVSITIAGEKISACTFVTRQKDGSVKDESYGKVNGEISNRDYYDKAQLAVRVMKKYETEFLRTGNLKDVEAVSGATIAYDQFSEAAENALAGARK